VLRDFTSTELKQLWLSHITEHWTDEGKLHICAITDVCSNRVVGYSIDSRMTAELAVAALRNAVALRDPAGTTLHSD
jgi:putative transposase